MDENREADSDFLKRIYCDILDEIPLPIFCVNSQKEVIYHLLNNKSFFMLGVPYTFNPLN